MAGPVRSARAGDAAGAPRDAIRAAAVRLFGKQGYSGTSMRDIAGAVGVLPGSLYAHIAGKEALLFEIVEEGIARFLDAVEPAAATDAPAQTRLRAMIVAHVEVVAQNPEHSLVVFHQWRYLTGDSLPRAIERRRAYERAFVAVVKDGIDEGAFQPGINIRIAVLTVLGALNWTPEWISADGPLAPAEVGGLIADRLLDGLRR